MDIIKKSNTGYYTLPLNATLLSQRLIFLEGTITSEAASLVLKQLLYLEAEDERAPVKLILNSPGGSVSAGLMLYHQMKAMRMPLDIYGVEFCASMAAILLAGGKPGHRHLLRGSKCMIHEPLVSPSTGGISGSASSIQRAAESILKTKDILDGLLAEDTGHTIEEIRLNTLYDHFMEDEEALKFNLVDFIVDRI